jgi:predicted RND superfamily exporter protein
VSSVNYSNNILTVKTSCEISSDCKVELKSEECKSGKRKDVYDVIFKATGRGKTCENTVRELVNDTNLDVRDEGNKVIVEGSCPNFEELDRQADTKKFGVISIVVFILIILFAIFFL